MEQNRMESIILPSSVEESLLLYNQGHLITAFKALSCPSEQSHLLQQLCSLNLPLLASLHQQASSVQPQPPSSHPLHSLDNRQSLDNLTSHTQHKYTQLGYTAINKGQLAIVIMAAGQGSRLGFEHPKGMYDIQLQSHLSIFHMICKRLVKLQQLAQQESKEISKGVQLIIMTSPMNHQETSDYFHQHSFFSLSPSQVTFFQQGTLPALSLSGQVLLSSPSSLLMAPNGNGGIYQALHDNNIIQMLQHKQIQYTQIIGVDNVLVRIGDPLFVGYMVENGYLAGAKYINKASWDEKVGVHCIRNGRVEVVEYSELSADYAQSQDDQGQLVFNTANIVNMMLHTSFLSQLDSHALCVLDQKIHLAHKKVNVYDVTEKQMTQIDGVKFEMFVFDVYGLLTDSLRQFGCLEAKREEEFAPVKNQEGKGDSPDTARGLISRLSAQWLINAGYQIQHDPQNHITKLCEIDQMITYQGEGLENIGLDKDVPIQLPFYLK